MQYSEAINASEALGKKIESSPNVVLIPDVSSEVYDLDIDVQLSFDLKIEGTISSVPSGAAIESPTKNESIGTDFYYALRTLIENIAEDVEAQKETILSLNTTRKKTIAQELENIISELNDFKSIKPVDPNHLDEWVYASFDSLQGRGVSVFCSRATYFTAIRLLLIHYWKGLGFFKDQDRDPYKEPNFSINQFISKFCSNLVTEKNNWLFAKQSNYSWYKISPDTLKEIETILNHWELNEDSIIILSKVYERYLDENRLRKYSHYTPPLLVKFIWDFLIDHSDSSSLFRALGKNRIPKLVFDPTMGSGNFLVEAAKRMKEELAEEKDPKKFLKELNLSLTTGLFGCDIDIFAHFFSEVKMLWILSSLIHKYERMHLSLSIIHQNALKLYSPSQLDMNIVPEGDSPLSTDMKFGLNSMEGHLKLVHSKIRIMEKFDICIGCPPEQILKEQTDFMKEVIQKIPYWKKYYETNLLYSSWFFVLGLSKLREGGRLIFITEKHWPTEEGASKLREYILQECKIISLIDLGFIKMDEDTTPLPRYITLLEKCSQKAARDNHKVKIVKVHPQQNQVSAAFILGKIAAKAKTIDKPGKIYADDDIDIYFSGLSQGELNDAPWQHMADTGFSKILKEILKYKTTLQYFCNISEEGELVKGQVNLAVPEVHIRNHFTAHDSKEEQSPEMTQNKITLQLKPICKESPYYLQALLNSPVLNFWYAHNGNKKNGKKFYDTHSLKMIPIRPISFSKPIDVSIYEEKMAQVKNALSKKDHTYMMAALSLELSHGREEIVHDAIVMIQKELLAIEINIGRYNSFFKGHILDSLTTSLTSSYEPLSFKAQFPFDQQCALKDHKNIFIHRDKGHSPDQFCLIQYHREMGTKNEKEHLVLISKDNKMIKIYASTEFLDFIEQELKSQLHNFWDEIEGAIYLPKDESGFLAFKGEIIEHCESIRQKYVDLQKVMHDLIFKLYDFDAEDKDLEKSKEASIAIDMMIAG